MFFNDLRGPLISNSMSAIRWGLLPFDTQVAIYLRAGYSNKSVMFVHLLTLLTGQVSV